MVRFGPRHRSTAALVALLTANCAGPGVSSLPIQPTTVPLPNSPSGPPANNPPQVTALTVSSDRAEVGEEVTISATVTDDESPVNDLSYSWAATSGTIIGTGPVAKWKAPVGSPTPAAYKISLVVVDKYGVGEQSLEHRVTAESEVHVNDSPKEVRALSEEFIRDFANSSLSPETCVRNFSDSCRGKRAELQDIIDNRNGFRILSHTFSVSRVTVNASRTSSTVSGACEFRSIVKATGLQTTAKGTCVLTLVNENYRWWLCDSRMTDGNAAALTFPF